ncbi:HAD-IA family hydrolase [Vallitalea pronyensis]|uniref:HAD-IA family hydrolase n=1 Tax=Vallitalea pronyensis TaxID=1348613 RepID=A0A8J8MIR3_9FIRM|nr:HAD-IA family hydrolase [Vallitalea pronyensis]QUI22192.1 HAD-IA family hydrolase [Vallitalea pronyensis]
MKFVWFDLGYTLIYLEREEPYKRLLNRLGIHKNKNEIEQAFHLTDKYFMREKLGFFNGSAHGYMDEYLLKLNHFLDTQQPISYKDMVHVYQEEKVAPVWQRYDFTLDVLNTLKDHHIGIGLLSNWDTSARRILEELKLLELFDEVIISSEVNITKPNKEIFAMALEKTGLHQSECIYVGDNYYDDIVGCQRVGIEGKLINRFGRTGIEELSCEAYANIGEVVKAYL